MKECKKMDSVLRNEIKRDFDFGAKVFDREQFEAELLKKFNKVEIRKIEETTKGEAPIGIKLAQKDETFYDPLGAGDISAIGGPLHGPGAR
jgi:hypothetical protein